MQKGDSVRFSAVLFIFLSLSLSVSTANAQKQVSDDTCLSSGQLLLDNNDDVIKWKTTTANEWRSRAHVTGTVDRVYADQTGHRHFSLKIGPQTQDNVEIIFNLGFGKDMPVPQEGDTAVACGDYITSFAQSGGYQASPDGALVHWVHRSDTPKHDSGFVILNGVEYGN
jgi:hypothetical protein